MLNYVGSILKKINIIMLLKGAIGDAYGAGFEFAERMIIDKENDLTHYRAHPRYQSIYKKYTDDTQMALALAELLIEQKELSRANIADKFVEVFKRDVREGYASRFYNFLLSINSGEELLEKIIAKSERNGAVMRAYPLGILKTESEIIEKNAIQMANTHNTPTAKTASEAIALTAHFFIYNKGNQYKLIEYLNDIQGYNWQANWQSEVTMNAIETVEADLTILKNETSLKNMLQKSVNFGGDVDTVASLTLAIGSQIENVEDDLPIFLFDELENGNFGRDYLSSIDKQLLNLK